MHVAGTTAPEWVREVDVGRRLIGVLCVTKNALPAMVRTQTRLSFGLTRRMWFFALTVLCGKLRARFVVFATCGIACIALGSVGSVERPIRSDDGPKVTKNANTLV